MQLFLISVFPKADIQRKVNCCSSNLADRNVFIASKIQRNVFCGRCTLLEDGDYKGDMMENDTQQTSPTRRKQEMLQLTFITSTTLNYNYVKLFQL